MLNYFRDIFLSENDQDLSWVRLFRGVLTVGTLAMVAVVIIDFGTNHGNTGTTIYVETALALVAGAALYLAHRKVYWPGKLLIPLGALVAVTYLAINSQGQHDSSITAYILVIILSGLLIGRKAIPFATGLTIAGTFIVTYADISGINQSNYAQTSRWFDAVVISIIQIIAAASLNALMNRLGSALQKSQANELAQLKSNQELRELHTVLEQRVIERTQSLELAAKVGRTLSRVTALDVMLKDAAELIRSEFDLYYVQLYLTDPAQANLILKSGTGEVGAELVIRGHRLPINSTSINGRAAIEKHSVVVTDTATRLTFLPNPLLPETRSEMAVPLMLGEDVVGVLDLQSRNSGGMSRELGHDLLPAFEALAGQLAIAIQNAKLLTEAEQARAEVETQVRRLTRANWQDYLDAIHKPEQTGFMFERETIKPLPDTAGYQPAAPGGAISAPIAAFTGEPLGSLVVEMGTATQNPQTFALVHTVARQVAQQIEALRLVESAERYRAEAEEASRRLTREGWKGYIEKKNGQSLGYLYDLKEVKQVGPDVQQAIVEPSLSLPLKIGDEPIGKLVVQGVGEDDGEAVRLINAVADRLGTHIESLRQFDQTQSALAQSETLFEASRRLTQTRDLQDLVKATVESLNIPVINRAILGAFSYNAAGELESMTDVANYWNGTGSPVSPVGTFYSAKTLQMLHVFLSETPLFFNDAFNDERLDAGGLQIAKMLNLRAGAVLPLFQGTRQLGILMLQAEEIHTFTQEEIRLYTALAPQIATILESRRQFERAQKQAERESTMNLINQKIQSATTVEAVLQIAARELGHALGAPLTVAQLGIKGN